MIHDQVIAIFTKVMPADTALLAVWLVPVGLFIVLLGRALRRSTLRFSAAVRAGFALAAAVFLTGAVGLDVVAWLWNAGHVDVHMPSELLATIEELLKMTGVILFIRTLLVLLETRQVSRR